MKTNTKQKKLSSFAAKARRLIWMTAMPLVCMIVALLVMLMSVNRQYNNIVENLTIASNFNDQFKTTLDEKMYQVVINRDKFEELSPLDDIEEAQNLVLRLKKTTTDEESLKRLSDIEKYLNSLVRNMTKIFENAGYDQNMQILEKRIYVLTSLVDQKMQGYIYHETRLMAEIRDQKNVETIRITAAFGAVSLAVVAYIIIQTIYTTESLTKPLKELGNNLKSVGEGDFTTKEINVTSEEVYVLNNAFQLMVEQIDELMRRVRQEQNNLRRTEFQLLQSQINPHFLYNTFDTIIWLTEDGKYEIVKQLMISLSNFYRVALSGGEDVITIKEEIQHVQSYLEIQQVRYSDVLSYEIDISEDILNYTIPKLTLQPIVENALYHGIKNKRGGGTISIEGRMKQDRIILRITDSGIGMTKQQLRDIRQSVVEKDKRGYGLANVFERVKIYYGESAAIEIESEYNAYTTIQFEFPAKSNATILE